jgi:PHP family Zn ribbon phosphoesterase
MATRNSDYASKISGSRRAAKDHTCKGCGGKIPKGMVYYRLVAEGDDDDGKPPFPGPYHGTECVGKAQFHGV